MKIEIRRSFEKDASKLPPGMQQHLATVIQQILSAKKISEIAGVKKLTGFKNATGSGWEIIESVFFVRATPWS